MWRAGFEQSRQLRVESGDCDVYAEHIRAGDFFHEIDIAHDEIRLRDYADVPAAIPAEYFEDRPCASEAPLGGLVRVCGGADRDPVFPVDLGEFLAEQMGRGRFGVDSILEIG